MMLRRRKILLFLLCFIICFLTKQYEVERIQHAIQNRNWKETLNVDQMDNGIEPKEYEVKDFSYKFLIDEPNICGKDLRVINIMPVTVNDFASRTRIRKLWGSPLVVNETKLRPIFLVGESPKPNIQRRLQNESDTYHDILQLSFMDTYLNLTLKTLSALYWKQSRCQHVPWLLKSDVDVFVNPWVVSQFLSSNLATDIVCRMLYNKPVCRPHNCKDKRWIIPPELYPYPYYPPYCNGPVYAVNQNYVRQILRVALEQPLFPMEDAYFTGILVKDLNLRYRDIGRRCLDHRHRRLPIGKLEKNKLLFLINPEEKNKYRYTFEDLWNIIYQEILINT